MEAITDYLQAVHGASFQAGDVQWAQGTNSRASLERALTNPAVHFVEVDVSLSESGEPIAAHPPESHSDLSIGDLLGRMATTHVGLKLDFKNEQVVRPVLERFAESPLPQPVLLNADVLHVARVPEPHVQAERFIEQCQSLYPQGILSLGWRTRRTRGLVYSAENVQEMIALTRDLETVTYPVRATMLHNSWHNVRRLLVAEGRTLTVWNTGPLHERGREWVRANTDPRRCFYATDIN
ncbi:MAG TPA: DUF2181 domain-containing protein [Candidatus Saccharimonadales bacterium]